MKKILFIILTTASMLTASAQTMLKQRIDQEIGTIIVKNNTIVRIEKDTCNYVAYLSDLSGPAAEAIVRNLVEITDTKLITTEAAKDKTIIVGTTADSCSFTIVNDGIVIHKGKTYSNELGELLIDGKKNEPDRNWTGLESYGFGKRFYWDFHYGWTNFANAGKGFISRGATSDVTKFEYGDVDVCIGYSIYKDHHFAAGLGLGFKAVGYTFNDPYIVAAQTGDSYTLEAMDAPLGTSNNWKTSLQNAAIIVPIHFQYFPNARDHSFNLKLDVIPSFCIMSEFDQEYKATEGNVSQHNMTRTNLIHNIFNCNLRFGINYDLLGVYVETSLMPISDNLKLGSSLTNNTFKNTLPYHISLGLTFRFDELD